MQVILLKDVPKVGHKYEVKTVSDGFAQNHLFPHKLAERASKQKLEQLDRKREAAEKVHAQEYDSIKKIFADAHGSSVHMNARANDLGHLFQGIKADDIAKVISEKTHAAITANHINRQEPIKDLGEYEIELEHDDLKAIVTLVVKKEDE